MHVSLSSVYLYMLLYTTTISIFQVNIAESFNDEETPKTHSSRSTKLGNPSTRQSWHGQSQTRVPSRHSPTNRTMTPMNGSTRHSFSSRSGPQQRQSVHFQRGTRDEKQVHFSLIPGNNHHRLRNHWSTGSLRLSGSERPRVLPDTVVMNRPHGHPSMKQTVHPNFERNLNGIRNRNDGRAQSWDADIRSERLRSPPDYLTAVKRSQGTVSNCFLVQQATSSLWTSDLIQVNTCRLDAVCRNNWHQLSL